MAWLSRLVTVVLVLALAAGGVLLVRSALPKQTIGAQFRTFALLRDGSRLAVGSPVVIAGVRVGEIEKLTVSGDFARADLLLSRDFEPTTYLSGPSSPKLQVPRDSWITKRAESAFGDSYLEIIPSADEGAPVIVYLQNGEQITRVIEGSSTDQVLRTITRAMPRADQALENMHDVLGNGRRWVDAAMRDGAERTTAWLADGKIEAGMAAADRAAERLDRGTERAAASLSSARPDFLRTLDRADAAIARTRTKIADVRSGLHDGLERVRTGLDAVDQPIADYQGVVTAINEGTGKDYRGTLGRLINDPSLGDQLDTVTDDARGGADSISRFKSWLGMRFEYNVFSRIPRFYATAELRSRNDKFYLIELERDPLGGLPSDVLSDAAGTTTYTRTIKIEDKLRFTAQFGKQFGWLALRGGIKDSSFGVGADALLLNEGRLRLSIDAFGGYAEAPKLKLAAAFAVFRSVYLLAGIDDALTKPGYIDIDKDSQFVPNDFHKLRYGRDYFLGATLHFDDADLATLLRVYGALLVSAL